MMGFTSSGIGTRWVKSWLKAPPCGWIRAPDVLRRLVVLVGVGLLVAGGVAAAVHAFGAALYLLVTGGAYTAGVLFERWRYSPAPPRIGNWHATGERFIDPTSGKMVEVYFNRDTGERHYREQVDRE